MRAGPRSLPAAHRVRAVDRRQACLWPWVAGSWIDQAGATDANTIQAPTLRRRLRFALRFSNPTPSALGPQAFWCYLPALSTGTQRLLDVRVSMARTLLSDAASHQILHLSLDGLPAYAQRSVSVAVELELRAEPIPETMRVPMDWLGAERFIEADDPAIRALAKQLQRHGDSDTARAIFDWVRGNLTYAGYLADERGAAQALSDLRGDCTEYADLAAALARACGIPARVVGGFVTDRDATPRASDYHDWTEMYLHGAWRLVDCQKQRWLHPAHEYVAFRLHRGADLNPIGNAQRFRVDGGMVVMYS